MSRGCAGVKQNAVKRSRVDLTMKQQKICDYTERNTMTMQEILADCFSKKQNLQIVQV